ncbi:MAG: carboxypeptidase M32 [Actinomycetota bacterium]
MSDAWERFEERCRELEDIAGAIKLCHWDQEVMMPPKGGPGRARTLATLQGIAHDRLTDPEMGSLVGELEHDDTLGEVKRASVRIVRREYDKATKVPQALVREMAEAEARAYQTWTKARPGSDFKMLEPELKNVIELKKQQADAIGWEDERYDALLDEFEPTMKAKEVETMFRELETSLRPIVDVILDAAGERPTFLGRSFEPRKQEDFCRWLVKELGFDMESGRLDTSPHPFTMPVGAGDVRQTTRADRNDHMMSIYAAMHETGHALYEQHLPDELVGLPVGQVPSLGLHESQSRLWENQVGRSRAFTDAILPRLRETFPSQLEDVDADTFYRGANHPERTLIRVTADEVTYNLHVALRFELELAIFRDQLEVADLPGAWNDSMQKWVGITPPDDADGVLQDMHWSIGALGYFPTYTLGTLYSAALFDKATADLGPLDDELEPGKTGRLLAWLEENIYSKAYLYPAKDLAQQVLGRPISTGPFIEYLKKKYGALYEVGF